MRHGVRIPEHLRDKMCRRAVQIWREKDGVRARTLEAICDEFDVSDPTARNLLACGHRLEALDAETPVAGEKSEADVICDLLEKVAAK